MAALNRPLFVTLVIFAALFLRAAAPLTFGQVARWLISRKAAVVASLGLMCAATFMALRAAHTGAFLDHVEPTVAGVSWKFVHGSGLYLRPDALDRYSLVYGSAIYAWYGAILRVFGASIGALKWSVAGLNVAAFFLLWRSLKKSSPALEAVVALSYVAAVWLWMFPALVWVRGDVLAFFLCCAAMAACAMGSVAPATVVFALACGLLVNIKITYVFVCLPLVWLFHVKRGDRLSAIAVGGSAAVFFLPFLHPGISFANYVVMLREASRHGFTFYFFLQNVRALLVLTLPPAVLAAGVGWQNSAKLAAMARQNRGLLASTVAGLLATAVLASKRGAGPHHLLVFVPILALVFSELLREWPAGAGWAEWSAWDRETAETVAVALLAVVASMATIHVMEIPSRPAPDSRSVVADLRRVLSENPGRQIEMGYGTRATYALTWFRPVLVFAGQPLTLDAASLMDSQYGGDEIPAAAAARLQSCRGKIWLVPRQEAPFSLQNIYADWDGRKLNTFDRDFRARFLQSYAVSGHSEYFDVWRCKLDLASAAVAKGE